MTGGRINNPIEDIVVSVVTAVLLLVGAGLVLAPFVWLLVRAWTWALGA